MKITLLKLFLQCFSIVRDLLYNSSYTYELVCQTYWGFRRARVERARQPQCAMQNVGYADKEMIVYQIFVY